METEQPSTNKKVITAFVLVLAVVIIAVGVTVFAKKKDSDTASSNTSTTAATPAASGSTSDTSTSSTSTTAYKDGMYTASGSYSTPESQETIGVTLTIKDGVVTDTSLEQHANAAETKEYQARFASGYKQLVVGKKLSDIRLSRVSGSSLTSQGFNSAVQDIAGQAKQS